MAPTAPPPHQRRNTVLAVIVALLATAGLLAAVVIPIVNASHRRQQERRQQEDHATALAECESAQREFGTLNTTYTTTLSNASKLAQGDGKTISEEHATALANKIEHIDDTHTVSTLTTSSCETSQSIRHTQHHIHDDAVERIQARARRRQNNQRGACHRAREQNRTHRRHAHRLHAHDIILRNQPKHQRPQ